MPTVRKAKKGHGGRVIAGFAAFGLALVSFGLGVPFLGPAASAAEPTVSLDGLGSITLGSRVDFGNAKDCEIVDVPDRDGVSALLRGGVVSRIAVRSTAFLTPSGIGVGFSEKKLLSVYGSLIRKSSFGYEVVGSSSTLQFELDNQKKVSVIRTSKKGEIGCDSSASVETPTSKPAIGTDTSTGNSASSLGNRLAIAYPGVVSYSDGKLVVNGQELPLNENLSTGTFDARMKVATIGDQFSIEYPMGCPAAKPAKDHDPGRLRNEAFFRAMYGSSSAAVQSKLRSIDWFGSKVLVTSVNDVAGKLEKVRDELNLLPSLRPYLAPSGGTFVWRAIDGTNNLSMHSFGIAIDINTKYSDYWRWSSSKSVAYRNRIPCEIALVFEKHGFIWGAKWYHFDTMHFEYRPELLN